VLVSFAAALPFFSMLPFVARYSSKEAMQKIYPGNAFFEKMELSLRLAEVTSAFPFRETFGQPLHLSLSFVWPLRSRPGPPARCCGGTRKKSASRDSMAAAKVPLSP
jgi:hypothetical protein